MRRRIARATNAYAGSRALSVLGEKDASVQTSATLNGQPYPVNMTNYPELFRTEALDNGTTYTFTLYYGGTGLLSVTVLFIEKAGHTLPTPRTPDPDPAPVPSQSSTVSSTTSCACLMEFEAIELTCKAESRR